ncbi:flagellar hook-length control protein FliK [Pseudooceanicola sp. MF1-13]|uniref:flagellar hook-length control protein FliK n=1 Tax=Pseudooceanicola sp. MF1-13 TaxID=3379095 RepID=UPI00389255C5
MNIDLIPILKVSAPAAPKGSVDKDGADFSMLFFASEDQDQPLATPEVLSKTEGDGAEAENQPIAKVATPDEGSEVEPSDWADGLFDDLAPVSEQEVVRKTTLPTAAIAWPVFEETVERTLPIDRPVSAVATENKVGISKAGELAKVNVFVPNESIGEEVPLFEKAKSSIEADGEIKVDSRPTERMSRSGQTGFDETPSKRPGRTAGEGQRIEHVNSNADQPAASMMPQQKNDPTAAVPQQSRSQRPEVADQPPLVSKSKPTTEAPAPVMVAGGEVRTATASNNELPSSEGRRVAPVASREQEAEMNVPVRLHSRAARTDGSRVMPENARDVASVGSQPKATRGGHTQATPDEFRPNSLSGNGRSTQAPRLPTNDFRAENSYALSDRNEKLSQSTAGLTAETVSDLRLSLRRIPPSTIFTKGQVVSVKAPGDADGLADRVKLCDIATGAKDDVSEAVRTRRFAKNEMPADIIRTTSVSAPEEAVALAKFAASERAAVAKITEQGPRGLPDKVAMHPNTATDNQLRTNLKAGQSVGAMDLESPSPMATTLRSQPVEPPRANNSVSEGTRPNRISEQDTAMHFSTPNTPDDQKRPAEIASLFPPKTTEAKLASSAVDIRVRAADQASEIPTRTLPQAEQEQNGPAPQPNVAPVVAPVSKGSDTFKIVPDEALVATKIKADGDRRGHAEPLEVADDRPERIVQDDSRIEPRAPMRTITTNTPQQVTIEPISTPVETIASHGGEDILPQVRAEGLGEQARPSPSTMTSPIRPDMGPRVAEQVYHATKSLPEGAIEITLKPEELGRVRMQVTAVDQSVTLTITAERPETLDLLRRHIDQLAQDYKSQGFTDVRFDFATDGGEGDAATNGQGQTERNDLTGFGAEPEQTTQDAPTLASVDGLDIRI